MKTKDNKTISIKILNWNDVVDKLTIINPSLASAMAKSDFDSQQYRFYLASYPFGNDIINNQKSFLPLEDGGSISFNDSKLPDSIREDLGYNPKNEDPLGIILNKTSEFYLLGEQRVQPHTLITPGQMFGIPRAIDSSPNTSSVLEANLNSGCRSVFMLPKISDQVNHRKLQETYAINLAAPTLPQEHWHIFKEINKQSANLWRTEVLFFPRNWINQLASEEWIRLQICLVHIHRKSYSIWHKVSSIWDKSFHEIEQEKNLNKYYPMQSLLTAKQLFKTAAGVIHGFRPATNDESAPVELLKEIYSSIYNKLAKPKYSPIIMEPCNFVPQSGEPVYNSLNYATFTSNHLDSSKKKSHISLLEEIRIVTELYKKGIIETKSDIQSLYNIAKNAKFTYYHTNPENYAQIKNIALLEADDIRFTSQKHEEFPIHAPFFKGCVKVSYV